MQEQRRWPVRDSFGVHRMDHAQVVGMLGRLRKQVRNPVPAFTILPELPGRFHDTMQVATAARFGNGTGIIKRHRLAVMFDHAGFEIEGIDVTRPALHEQKDDSLGPWR